MIFRELESWWTPDSSLMMESCPSTGPCLTSMVTSEWWTGFGEAGGDNVLILPGVSLTEAQEFVDLLYGRQNVISDRHFTVREDTGVADEFVCNNNSDCEDVKLAV